MKRGIEPGWTRSCDRDNQENEARGGAPESFFSAKPKRENERGYAVAGRA